MTTEQPKKAKGAKMTRKRPHESIAEPIAELDQSAQDTWGWKRVALPAATNAPDEDMGGLFMLEEIDGVDIEYKSNETGAGKSMRFKRVGSAKKGRASKDEDDGATGVVMPNDSEFIDIDDFKEETAKSKKVKKLAAKASKEAWTVKEKEVGEDEDPTAEMPPDPARKKARKQRKTVASQDITLEDMEAQAEVEAPAAEGTDLQADVETSTLAAWEPFKLARPITKALQELGFDQPTPIQAKCLPVAMQWKRDIVGTAETGSGKTLAFGLPILDFLVRQEEGARRSNIAALIVTPTRELAIQIADHLAKASQHLKIRIASVVGGMSIQKQQRQLDNVPDVVIATPGRLWEILSNSDPLLDRLRRIKFLVLDEADRMLEFGHYQELSSILKAISLRHAEGSADAENQEVNERQTLVFSATLAKADFVNKSSSGKRVTSEKGISMRDLLKKIEFKDDKPIRIDLTHDKVVAAGLKELQVHCLPKNKDAYIYYCLLTFPGRTMVFVASIDAVTRLMSWLKLLNLPCFPLHGKLQQRQRLRNLDRFKSSDRAVLIATDVAARGLDIPEVQHVIHFHVARNAQTYVHRSGRTARAGKDGVSVSLVAPEEVKGFNRICQTLKKTGMGELPVDRLRLGDLQKRVTLAVSIEKAEHKLRQDSSNKSWIQKVADEMDIELDDDL